MTKKGWQVGLLLAAMVTCNVAWGQARREGIPGVVPGTVWFDDFDEALTSYVALCKRGGQAPFQDLTKGAGLRSPFEDGALDEVVAKAAETLAI